MGITRLIIIIALVWLVYTIYQRLKNTGSLSEIKSEKLDNKKMVMCEICDLHIPADEAIEENGFYFCSKEHQDTFHQ